MRRGRGAAREGAAVCLSREHIYAYRRTLTEQHRATGSLSERGPRAFACWDIKDRTLDSLNPSERSARMAKVRGFDTKPEMFVRRLVHGMGFRYRLHDSRLPGTPDLVFPSRRKAILVHGCFWHRHPDMHCKLARMPKSRLEFWRPKLEGNRERDLRHQAELTALGWQYLIVWECRLGQKEQLQNAMRKFLSEGDP